MNQICTLLTVMTLSLATAIGGVIDIGSRRELFVDRHMVDEITATPASSCTGPNLGKWSW